MPALASLLVHAVGAVTLVLVAPRMASRGLAAADAPAETPLEFQVDEAPAEAPPALVAEAPALALAPPVLRAAIPQAVRTVEPAPPSPATLAPDTAAAPAASAPATWSFSATTPQALDLGAATRAAALSERPPRPASSNAPEPPPGPAPPASPGLAESLATRDAQLGLGPAAPVVGALRRATLDHITSEGTATARVTFDGQGHVASVRLLHATGPQAAWSQTLDAATRAAAAASPSLAGATVDVRIDVRLVPGAASPTKPVDIHGETWALSDPDFFRKVRDVAIRILGIAR
jgi:hypothetical protein